jgi:hypothetical protein
MNINIKAGLITALILGIIATAFTVITIYPRESIVTVGTLCIALPIVILFRTVKDAVKAIEHNKLLKNK